MTVTDGIDLVALLIENDLCSDDTPEHIKADLSVFAQIIKMLQTAYPFTVDDEIADIAHRQYNATEELNSIIEITQELREETKAGKFHNTRQRDAANHE